MWIHLGIKWTIVEVHDISMLREESDKTILRIMGYRHCVVYWNRKKQNAKMSNNIRTRISLLAKSLPSPSKYQLTKKKADYSLFWGPFSEKRRVIIMYHFFLYPLLHVNSCSEGISDFCKMKRENLPEVKFQSNILDLAIWMYAHDILQENEKR